MHYKQNSFCISTGWDDIRTYLTLNDSVRTCSSPWTDYAQA